MGAVAVEEWSGLDVSVAQIEAELARLREVSSPNEQVSRQRTSVMTHIAWVPPSWLSAAEQTLEGMAARHPSRTVILIPEAPAEPGRIDAELSVRCFSAGDREICGEVIELHLRGDRAAAPASIVVPLAIADLPLFLRWRGEPPFGAGAWEQLVDLADRVVVDSSEWVELRYAELSQAFGRAAFSDLAWARIHPWRVALAARWPAIRDEQVAVAGPPAEAALLRGWLGARLGREIAAVEPAEELVVELAGRAVEADAEELGSPSDLLSAELDRFGRDRIYEEAVAAIALEAGTVPSR